jgi:HK97 family phage major capsid protein
VFNPRTLPVETIAHIFKISRQMYDDLPAVAAQIENNGIYGVKKAEDNQLLNGTGTSPQLKGFNPVATDVAAPALPATLMDSIGTVIFTLASQGYMADGLVLNPADWAKVALSKNSQGNYLFANPIDYTTAPRIWGVRMVMSTHQAAGTFLVGAFQGNSQILDREEVNVQIAEQNVDDFEKNMLTIRVEERLVLLIFQPAAFANGATPA